MKSVKQLHKLLLILLFVGLPFVAVAGETYDENRLKAAITYNVAKFVKWPGGIFVDEKSPLVICVLGNGDSDSGFSALEGQLLGKRPVLIRYLEPSKKCRDGHILYVAGSAGPHIDATLIALQNAPILTISDIDGFTDRGGMISLVKVRKNIRFSINLDASMAANLQISSKLHPLATEVIRNGGVR